MLALTDARIDRWSIGQMLDLKGCRFQPHRNCVEGPRLQPLSDCIRRSRTTVRALVGTCLIQCDRLPLREPMDTSTLRRVFKAFQYRDFRLMWIGACTSSIGTWMQIVAQGWLIYRLSHSSFLLGLDQFLAGIPIFLFSLIGGVVADRAERRRILMISQYIQMASAAILTALVATGFVQVWEILCLSFFSGLAQAFGGPAYQALIPTLVDRDDMPNAIALNSIQFNLAVTVGPALAGITLAR